MLRRGRLLILLGLILALITAGVAYYLLRGMAPAEEEEAPTALVLVARQSIGEREEITADAVGTEERPQKYVPANALSNPVQAIGKVAMVPISEGQPILSSMVMGKEEAREAAGFASLGVPEGKVAFAVPIEDRNSVAGAIQAGDFVDVLVTIKFTLLEEVPTEEFEEGEKEVKVGGEALATQLTLQDVEVLRVGLWTPPPPTEEGEIPAPTQNYLTLLVNQQDALVLLYLRDDPKVTIDFALRGIEDHTIVSTESVTLQYILTRFNVTTPAPPPTVGP